MGDVVSAVVDVVTAGEQKKQAKRTRRSQEKIAGDQLAFDQAELDRQAVQREEDLAISERQRTEDIARQDERYAAETARSDAFRASEIARSDAAAARVQEQISPFLEAGGRATEGLEQFIGSDYAEDPYYQAGLETQIDQARKSMAARGGLDSGAALELERRAERDLSADAQLRRERSMQFLSGQGAGLSTAGGYDPVGFVAGSGNTDVQRAGAGRTGGGGTNAFQFASNAEAAYGDTQQELLASVPSWLRESGVPAAKQAGGFIASKFGSKPTAGATATVPDRKKKIGLQGSSYLYD
jgi:hypothetical protein